MIALGAGKGQLITNGFSRPRARKTGVNVTARNLPWNAVIAPGGNVQIGFYGSHANANPVPDQFRVNGVLCSVQVPAFALAARAKAQGPR